MRTCLILTAVCLFCSPLFAADPLVIHEWGTFTSLQNEKGEAIGWLNTDDEPVPAFVHTLDASAVLGSPSPLEHTTTDPSNKGLGALHPDVTMRLETPVMYFYAPKDRNALLPVDVSVEFHGGYLTQFYPNADGGGTRLMDDQHRYVRIKSDTVHKLAWKLQVGASQDGPHTDSPVWTTPRQVQADTVRSGNEAERFVFYRGVGHLDSPFQVIFDGNGYHLAGPLASQPANGHDTRVQVWLVDIRADESMASDYIEPVISQDVLISDRENFGLRQFEERDYSPSSNSLALLKRSIHKRLTEAGLFDDEATAMLNTWNESYFKSTGLRLFYIVPQTWTDKVLPLEVSVPAKITRVMVGRIELVTPQQRALLANLKDEDIPQLGRFAGALMNDQQQRSPSPQMQAMIARHFYQPAIIAR